MSKVAEKLTATEIIKTIGEKVDVKPKVVKDVVYALSNLAGEVLKKGGEFRIPHIGRLTVQKIPSKVLPAGDYTNPFKKGEDGKPLVEYKERRVKPARTKLKFLVASQIKNAVVPKK